MKPREPRTKVMLQARVRWDGRWIAATVRNISSRGLMLAAPFPPPPGTYVEVQLPAQTIVARAVWTTQGACGLLSQDRLNTGQIARGVRTVAISVPDRRATPRADHRHDADRSRHQSATMQYSVAVLFALGAAGTVGWEVYQMLATPVSAIDSALSGHEP